MARTALLQTPCHSDGLPPLRPQTCTFYVIGLTVLVNGGSVGYMLEHWDLKKKPALPTASSSSPLLDGGGDDGDASVDDDAPRKRGVGGSPAGASAMSQGADGEAVLVVRASVVALAGGELDGGLSPTRKAGLPTVAEGSGPAAVGGGPPPALARLSSLSRASLSRTSGEPLGRPAWCGMPARTRAPGTWARPNDGRCLCAGGGCVPLAAQGPACCCGRRPCRGRQVRGGATRAVARGSRRRVPLHITLLTARLARGGAGSGVLLRAPSLSRTSGSGERLVSCVGGAAGGALALRSVAPSLACHP